MVTTEVLRGLSPGATLDLTGQEIAHPGRVTILRDLKDVRIKGGLLRAPLRFLNCSGVTIDGARSIGAEPRDRPPLAFYGCRDVTVTGFRARSWHTGLVMSDVDGFEVDDVRFTDMKVDGFQGAAVRNGALRSLVCLARRSDGLEHADAIQLRSETGKPMTSNVLIEDVEATGNIAGIRCTQAGGRMEKITVRRLWARVSTRGGATFAGVDGLTLDDLDVGTLAGSEAQAVIRVDKNCTGVAWEGRGLVEAYGTAAPQSFGA